MTSPFPPPPHSPPPPFPPPPFPLQAPAPGARTASTLLTLKIMTGTILMTPALFALVLFFVHGIASAEEWRWAMNEGNPVVTGLLLVAPVVAAWVAAELSGYRTPAIPPTALPHEAERITVAALTSTTTRRLAITDVPIMTALMLSFVTSDLGLETYLVGAALGTVGYLWHTWPSRRVLRRLQQSLERDGGRSSLGEHTR